MSHVPSLKDHQRRITALVGRVGDIETNHGRTLYELVRFKIKTDLRFAKLFAHFDIQDVSEEAVDEVLEAQ